MTVPSTDTVFAAIADRQAERRKFLRYAGGATVAAGGLSLLAACGDDGDDAITPSPTPTPSPTSNIGDIDLLNFALNLEYVEAQFYNWAAFGQALSASLTSGIGTAGAVTGGAQVPFSDPLVAQYAREIALDERQHVAFLRSTLSGAAVAQPAINIAGDAAGAFTAAARAAGVVGANEVFNPYANDINFLLGAYLFEDVGVSAYKGAVSLLATQSFREAAAGILAVEGYHAGLIRSVLYRKGIDATAIYGNAQKISDARDALDGTAGTGNDIDQGIGDATTANIVPADGNGLAFGRTTGQVLNIVYLNKASIGSGGFFPAGINGNIRTSAAN